MEILRYLKPAPLYDWGNRYDAYLEPDPDIGPKLPAECKKPRVLQIAESPTCPYCEKFTILYSPGSANNASRWRGAVTGFAVEEKYSQFYAGIVTVKCLECGNVFGYRVRSDAISPYQVDCPLWPQDKVNPLAGAESAKAAVLLHA